MFRAAILATTLALIPSYLGAGGYASSVMAVANLLAEPTPAHTIDDGKALRFTPVRLVDLSEGYVWDAPELVMLPLGPVADHVADVGNMVPMALGAPVVAYAPDLGGYVPAMGLGAYRGIVGGLVPEPGTWVMMIIGMGLVGWVLRRLTHPAGFEPAT